MRRKNGPRRVASQLQLGLGLLLLLLLLLWLTGRCLLLRATGQAQIDHLSIASPRRESFTHGTGRRGVADGVRAALACTPNPKPNPGAKQRLACASFSAFFLAASASLADFFTAFCRVRGACEARGHRASSASRGQHARSTHAARTHHHAMQHMLCSMLSTRYPHPHRPYAHVHV